MENLLRFIFRMFLAMKSMGKSFLFGTRTPITIGILALPIMFIAFSSVLLGLTKIAIILFAFLVFMIVYVLAGFVRNDVDKSFGAVFFLGRFVQTCGQGLTWVHPFGIGRLDIIDAKKGNLDVKIEVNTKESGKGSHAVVVSCRVPINNDPKLFESRRKWVSQKEVDDHVIVSVKSTLARIGSQYSFQAFIRMFNAIELLINSTMRLANEEMPHKNATHYGKNDGGGNWSETPDLVPPNRILEFYEACSEDIEEYLSHEGERTQFAADVEKKTGLNVGHIKLEPTGLHEDIKKAMRIEEEVKRKLKKIPLFNKAYKKLLEEQEKDDDPERAAAQKRDVSDIALILLDEIDDGKIFNVRGGKGNTEAWIATDGGGGKGGKK